MSTRDISQAEYERKLTEAGFASDGFMGYWHKNGIGISEYNAGPRRRDQLAYIFQHYARLASQKETVRQ